MKITITLREKNGRISVKVRGESPSEELKLVASAALAGIETLNEKIEESKGGTNVPVQD